MARLSTRDQAQVRELASWLGQLQDGAAPALGAFVRELRALLDTDRALAYAVTPSAGAYELQFGHWSGFTLPSGDLNRMMTASLARAHGPWALYNPSLPEGPQRNRVVAVPRADAMRAPAAAAYFARLGLSARQRDRYAARMSRLEQQFLRRVGMDGHHVCRALVCDGPRVLAWVGVSQPAAFGSRERALLGRLVPALQRRLRTERVLGDGPRAIAAMPSLLEAIPAAAFLIGANAAVQHANPAGAALLASEGTETREALADALRGRRSDVELTVIAAPGLPVTYLALMRRCRANTTAQLEVARTRWSLTRRQMEVLERVLRGDSNKEIAADLGVSTRAVELHVTRLFEKLGVKGRAALAGRVLGA
ncbi:MAG: LuxR C-terminal-related transcriptional regulator [Kofleriaceae bacterium]